MDTNILVYIGMVLKHGDIYTTALLKTFNKKYLQFVMVSAILYHSSSMAVLAYYLLHLSVINAAL